jgi:hypothetical protein
MAKHTLRSRVDQFVDGSIIPHNALLVYVGGVEYKRLYADGTLSRETYMIPLDSSSDEELWEELE